MWRTRALEAADQVPAGAAIEAWVCLALVTVELTLGTAQIVWAVALEASGDIGTVSSVAERKVCSQQQRAFVPVVRTVGTIPSCSWK